MLKKAKFECVPTLGGSLAQDVGILRDNVYHYHPEWELDYVVAGVGNILVGNEIVPYCVGSMDLIASNVPHFYSCLEDKTRESRTMVLKFNYENVIAPLEGIPEFASVVRLFSETGVALRFPVNVAYRDDLERIFQASPANKILLFWKMLLDVSALKVERVAAREPNFRLDSSGGECINKAVNYINRHFKEKLTLEMIAAKVGVTRDAFRRFFKASTNMNFADYLTGVRMTWCKKLMAETDMTIAAAAMDSGFNNLSNFNRLFLARYGMSPREYRKLLARR